MKKTSGFTLVEIIVVLIILAILVVATIPSMLGFVEKSKQNSITPEARAAYTATISIATEMTAVENIIDPKLDDEIIIAIAEGIKDSGDIGNGGLKVTYNEDGTVANDTRTDKMKTLLGDDADGQVQVIVKNGYVKYFYYKKEIGEKVSEGISGYDLNV